MEAKRKYAESAIFQQFMATSMAAYVPEKKLEYRPTDVWGIMAITPSFVAIETVLWWVAVHLTEHCLETLITHPLCQPLPS